MSQFQPIGDRVLVRPVDADKKSPGGIILPDTAAKEKPQEGYVVAVGPGRMTEVGERVPMVLQKGDHILFGGYAGNELKIGDMKVLVMREEDVMLVEMKENSNVEDASG